MMNADAQAAPSIIAAPASRTDLLFYMDGYSWITPKDETRRRYLAEWVMAFKNDKTG
jgi:hypothetical protein